MAQACKVGDRLSRLYSDNSSSLEASSLCNRNEEGFYEIDSFSCSVNGDNDLGDPFLSSFVV